jgi:hypothetical protein
MAVKRLHCLDYVSEYFALHLVSMSYSAYAQVSTDLENWSYNASLHNMPTLTLPFQWSLMPLSSLSSQVDE